MGRLSAVILVMIMVISLIPVPIYAHSIISIRVNGREIVFDAQEPLIADGRVLVPLREVFEAMQFYVIWDEYRQTAFMSDGINAVAVSVGQNYLTTEDGRVIELDVPAQIRNGRTMLPLRAVAEAVEARVSWYAEQNQVSIIYHRPAFDFGAFLMAPASRDEFMIPSIYHDGYIATNRLILGLVHPNNHIGNNEVLSAISSVGGVVIGHLHVTRSFTIQIPPRSETELIALGMHLLSEFPHIFETFDLYEYFGDTVDVGMIECFDYE